MTLQLWVKCPVYPTEDIQIVISGLELVLGVTTLQSTESKDRVDIAAFSEDKASLKTLRQLIHEKRIIDTVRSRLLANWDGSRTHANFDKQAATRGRVRLIDDSIENPPLGAICLEFIFKSKDEFNGLLDWFMPPTMNGRITRP